jgi:hypothetical protein
MISTPCSLIGFVNIIEFGYGFQAGPAPRSPEVDKGESFAFQLVEAVLNIANIPELKFRTFCACIAIKGKNKNDNITRVFIIK